MTEEKVNSEEEKAPEEEKAEGKTEAEVTEETLDQEESAELNESQEEIDQEEKEVEEVKAEKVEETAGEGVDAEEKPLEEEEEKEEFQGYVVNFKFDIDCIVEERDTKRKGRVESLTVNKYHEVEYFIEGNGISKWVAERHLILLRTPAEVKGLIDSGQE